MSVELSRQAKDCLIFLYLNRTLTINHRTLMDNCGLSRRKSASVLKELREANCLKMTRLVGGGTKTKLVLSDNTKSVLSGYSNIAVQQVSSIYNSYTASTTNIVTNKFFDEVKGKEEEVGYEFFERTSSGDDETILARKKFMEQKKAEYAEAKEAKAQHRKDLHRSRVAPINWTCKDVAYEFADRLADIWSIKPFSVAQSRFVQALSVFRKQHSTDGELELKLIELFFETIKTEKYTDGNHLWRAFLYKAPSLIQQAKEQLISVEEIETNIIRDEELTVKKLSLLDKEQDV
ncbi:MAG: hypothetical protein EBR82_19695 [Caulobacteraceae bacterium]|nr:hypothetical protein [Caulobacteraceae bacterium]